MTTKIDILHKIKSNSIAFIDDLIEQFPQEPDLVIMRVMIQDQIPIKSIADSFVLYLLPFKDMIMNKDEKFFLENDDIFKMIDSSKVFHFKKLWTSNMLDTDDRKMIWSWFQCFIILTEEYIKASI